MVQPASNKAPAVKKQLPSVKPATMDQTMWDTAQAFNQGFARIKGHIKPGETYAVPSLPFTLSDSSDGISKRNNLSVAEANDPNTNLRNAFRQNMYVTEVPQPQLDQISAKIPNYQAGKTKAYIITCRRDPATRSVQESQKYVADEAVIWYDNGEMDNNGNILPADGRFGRNDSLEEGFPIANNLQALNLKGLLEHPEYRRLVGFDQPTSSSKDTFNFYETLHQIPPNYTMIHAAQEFQNMDTGLMTQLGETVDPSPKTAAPSKPTPSNKPNSVLGQPLEIKR